MSTLQCIGRMLMLAKDAILKVRSAVYAHNTHDNNSSIGNEC